MAAYTRILCKNDLNLKKNKSESKLWKEACFVYSDFLIIVHILKTLALKNPCKMVQIRWVFFGIQYD